MLAHSLSPATISKRILFLTNPLSIFGLVCIAAAITGGGLKALGTELPVISSWGRQIALGLFGLILITISEKESILDFFGDYNMETMVKSGSLGTGVGKDISIQCGHRGTILARLDTLTPLKSTNGDNLSVHFRVCLPERNQCPWGQLAEGQSLKVKCEKTGEYNLNVFNFGTNPPVNFTTSITYPR